MFSNTMFDDTVDGLSPIVKLHALVCALAADLCSMCTTPMREWFPAVPDDTRNINAQSQRWQRLMVGAQEANPRAYADLLKEVTPFIRVIARRYHRDQGVAEDVVQETLISIHRIRHTYEPGRAVEPWIAAIARARAIDMLRSRMRRARIETVTGTADLELVPDHAPSHETTMTSRDAIAAAIEALPPAQRDAVRLLKIEELSLREASVASGLSVQALKSSLHRAMNTLRNILKDSSNA